MPQLSARIELPYLQPSQAQKHVTHNEALQRLDAVTQLSLMEFAKETPPTLPVEGDVYGLGAAPTGGWEGHAGDLAYWTGEAWIFVTPGEGWQAWGQTSQDMRIWRSGSWLAVTELQDLTLLGIGTEADITNRLAVASEAALFSHNGAGHQIKINKATAGDTASLLFQSNWAGHAEIGLAGDTALSFKVSPDGHIWHTVLQADPQAGQISLAPAGTERLLLSDSSLQLDVPLTGLATTQSRIDTTAGRLLKVGDGGVLGLEMNPVALGVNLDATDNSIAPGDYAIIPANWPGAPETAGWWHVRHVRRALGGGEIQFATREDGTLNSYVRSRTTGAWQPWSRVYETRNVLGTVSQSGGVPSGALIEAGSNANGSYLKFADGTLFCRHVRAASAGAGVVWAFPAVFATAPVAVGTTATTVLSAVTFDSAPSTTSATFSARDKTDARRADSCHMLAHGRWF
jgi:hypothetical protein